MPMCKILENYRNAEGWEKGDIVDITSPKVLIKEGKVKPVSKKEVKEEIEETKEEMSWSGLRSLASENDLYKQGMKKADVIEVLEENELI